MGALIDMTGKVAGRWTVLGRSAEKRKDAMWDVVCDCGRVGTVTGYALRSGESLSCGCLNRDVTEARAIHGRYGTSEYSSWHAAKQRCTNPNHIEYPRYGGRGIKFCQRWSEDFRSFFADMGPKPSAKHSIDRIDSDGDYEPGNCRWATAKDQASNRRRRVS